MPDVINFRPPKTLGCSVASTAVIQSLRERFSKSRISVYTKTPDLFASLTEVDELVDLKSNTGLAHYDIDLENYLESRRPQSSKPLRHLIEHMFEIAEEQLGYRLAGSLNRSFSPKVNLDEDEISSANKVAASLAQGKPLIWLQTKTRQTEKDLPTEIWEELIERCGKEYQLIDLSQGQYSRRQSIALTKCCDAGITLDSFLLHGSEAVHARNVMVILVSTHAEVVTYSDQTVLDEATVPVTTEKLIVELNALTSRFKCS